MGGFALYTWILTYTMVWTGLVSSGTTTAPFGSSGTKYTTVYTGGTFALYEGPVNARPYTAATVPLPATVATSVPRATVVVAGASATAACPARRAPGARPTVRLPMLVHTRHFR